ncbi:hypothetical protein Vadar_001459 [Vaccinium darrowii]|uniref:Uncharacterized protein n=1 Tax=Vaccinium darrowii TaxID=229202 RepID=A0ACB7Z0Z1_9ERIC|nr:hypothetical protein Vadar_001459 [Vaccinium darrowii]
MKHKVMGGTKIKQVKEDHNVAAKSGCIAKLPEPLLHHILSYLNMKNVIRTSVLAKRWRCSSLTVLALKGCIIQLPVKIKLGSLKTLSFDDVIFYGGAINDLLSSCSILEDLSFANCSWGNNHDLIIRNSGVKTLKIRGGRFYANSTLEINAPFIVSFELIQGLFSKYYIIKRMESLCSASFVCSKSDACHDQVCTNFSNLEYLCHVKDHRMCSCYIQAVSSKENPTQDCREKHTVDFISFDVTCLRIRTGLMKCELPGIAYILSHSPNVEALIITIEIPAIHEKELNDNFQEEEYWNLQEQKFVNVLCNLKDVKIYNFMKNLSWLESRQMGTSDDFLAHLKKDMNFLKFLLTNSMAMDRMTITTFKKVNFGRNSENKKVKLLLQLTQELLSFPRASRAAQISFN